MNSTILPIARFKLGRIVSTPKALETVPPQDVLTAIQRHQAGDWGDLSEVDRHANDQALTNGTRLLSVYHTERNCRFFLITEADRSVTTVLLPEEH